MTIKIGKSLDGLLSAQDFNSVFPQGSDFFKGFFKVVTFVDSLILYAKPYQGCAGEHSIHLNWGDGEGVYFLERGSLKTVYRNLFSVILGDMDLSGLTTVVINLKLELDSNLLVSKVGNDIILDKVPSTQKKVKAEKADSVNVKSPIKPLEKEAKSQNMGEVKQSRSYENLDVRLRFAKALREEVEGNLGDKITNLYDSKSLKESVRLLASSYTKDKEFSIRASSVQRVTGRGIKEDGVYGIFLKGPTTKTPVGYISEDDAMAYIDGNIVSGELPEKLEDGFRGMVGIAKYTDGSDKIILNVKITDKAILIDITK